MSRKSVIGKRTFAPATLPAGKVPLYCLKPPRFAISHYFRLKKLLQLQNYSDTLTAYLESKIFIEKEDVI